MPGGAITITTVGMTTIEIMGTGIIPMEIRFSLCMENISRSRLAGGDIIIVMGVFIDAVIGTTSLSANRLVL